jgi:hypothetical protein
MANTAIHTSSNDVLCFHVEMHFKISPKNLLFCFVLLLSCCSGVLTGGTRGQCYGPSAETYTRLAQNGFAQIGFTQNKCLFYLTGYSNNHFSIKLDLCGISSKETV